MKKFALTTLMAVLTFTAQAQKFTALTYNIKYDNTNDTVNNWNDRKDFLTDQIRYHHPDVFGTQEGLINQLKDMDALLEDYAYVGVGRDFGDDRGEHTAIYYNKNNVEMLEHHTFWLSETPDKPSKGWDAALNRICTYAIVKLKESGAKIMVFNTHFDHVGMVARLESSKLIWKKIKETNTANLPVVLMGDFNLDSSSEGVQYLSEHMTETHKAAGKNAFGPSGTFNGFEFNKPVTKQIDFIFSNARFKTLRSAILSDSRNLKYPSDHFPVIVQLELVND